MTPREIVANYYDNVLSRLDQGSSDLGETGCMIYLVVSVQRTIRASDFDAVFEVLLDDKLAVAIQGI